MKGLKYVVVDCQGVEPPMCENTSCGLELHAPGSNELSSGLYTFCSSRNFWEM